MIAGYYFYGRRKILCLGSRHIKKKDGINKRKNIDRNPAIRNDKTPLKKLIGFRK